MALPNPSRTRGPYRYRPIALTITRIPCRLVLSREEIEAELQASRRDGFHDALLGVLHPRWP
jgi:hypothetical protein